MQRIQQLCDSMISSGEHALAITASDRSESPQACVHIGYCCRFNSLPKAIYPASNAMRSIPQSPLTERPLSLDVGSLQVVTSLGFYTALPSRPPQLGQKTPHLVRGTQDGESNKNRNLSHSYAGLSHHGWKKDGDLQRL